MRIFYVTADGSRVGVLERALAHDASAAPHVEAAPTAEAVVSQAGALEPVVVLVDDALPDGGSESAVASLRAHLPRAHILVISDDLSAGHAGRLLLAGADEAVLTTQLSDLPARLARHGSGADDPRRVVRLGIVTDDGELADRAANAAGVVSTRLSIGPGATLTAPDGTTVDAVHFDVLVFDERQPQPETASALHAAVERIPPPAVVVLARAEDAAAWLRLGACEVVHEWDDAAQLAAALSRAQRWRKAHVEQVLLRSREARLRGLVESIPEAVLLSAPDGAILALNVAGLKLVGARGPRDVVGKKVTDLVADADRGTVNELLDAVVKGESRTMTLSVRRLDGSTAAIDIKAVPFQRDPGRPATMLAVLREASARTEQADDEWQEIPLGYDPTIESKLDELTRELEEARAEVLASRERVEQLRAAHESDQAVWQGRFDELTAAREALAASLQALEARQREEAQRLAARLDEVREEERQRAEAHLAQTREEERQQAEARLAAAREAERQQAEARLATVRAELEEAQRTWTARLEALDAERAAALANLAEVRTAHEAEVAALAGRLADERREAEAALRAEIDAARAELARSNEEWQAKFDEMTRAHAELDTELSGARHALTSERDALAARVEELEAAVRQAAEREAQAAIETGVRSLRMRELEEQLEAAGARVAAAERALAARDQALAAEQARTAEQEQARQALEARLAELENERGTWQRNQASVLEASARSLQEAQQALAHAERRAAELQREVEAITRDRDQAQVAFAAAQALAEEAERQIEAMRTESAGHEARLRTLAGDLEARDTVVAELQERVRTSAAALDEASAERQRLESALEEAGQRLVEALEAVERQQALVESHQSEMAAMAERLSAAEHDRDAARAEIQSLTQKLDAAEGERQQLVQALEAVNAEHANLVARLGALEAQRGRYDERYGWLFDFKEIGRMVVARDGAVISANDTAARMCGARSASEFVGVRTPASELFASALAASEARSGRQEFPRRIEICLQHGDGYLHWVLGVAQRQEGSGDAIDWMLLDVSDRHLMARRSRYLRRVDALTHFLASATSECAGLMRDVGETLRTVGSQDANVADAEQWQHAQKAVARTRSVLQQLSGFAQKRSRRPQVLELNDVLDKASVLLSRLAGEDTPCETRLSGEPILVSVDPGEFEQLLTNAVLAVRDSLPAGGHVTVAALKKEVDTELGGMPLTRREAVVSIEAEGFGAAEGVVSPKLVDMVARVGGELDLEHEPEVRTTFRIALPLVHRIEQAGQAQDQTFPATQPQGT